MSIPARRTGWGATAAYAVLVVYASLYPANEWQLPGENWWTGFLGVARWSRSDVISNVLAYIPLGLLLAWRIGARDRVFAPLVAVTLAGTALSLSVEIVQLFLPARVASIGDLGLNAAGTALGAWAGLRLRPGALPRSLGDPLREWLARPGATAGIAALALWVLSQWSPFVPSLDLVVWKLAGRDSQYGEADTGVKPDPAAVERAADRQGWQPTLSEREGQQEVLRKVIAAIKQP